MLVQTDSAYAYLYNQCSLHINTSGTLHLKFGQNFVCREVLHVLISNPLDKNVFLIVKKIMHQLLKKENTLLLP